ncbi:MAG: peptide ABC transporter substrate-binding protein [Trueperaceae bacterium]
MIRRLVSLVIASLVLLSGVTLAQERATVLSPQEPRTLLPHLDLLTLAHEVENLVFDCLYAVDAEGGYIPRLAGEVPTLENGGISEDGRTYTIRLRDDVSWQDGEPFTSDDVRFTWQVITDPDLPIPARTVWEDIQSIETPDPHTAVVSFAEPNVGFIGTAASDSCFILPGHALEGEDLVNSQLNRRPVGTGPYSLEEWASGSFIRLAKNPDYWGGEPAIDEIVVSFPGGSQAVRTSLQRGEGEVALHLTSADARFIDRLAGYELAQAPDHAWWQFWVNNQDPVLQERDVRAALAYALDKQTIADTVMGGLVQPQAAMLPAGHWAHNPDVPTYEFDPERARELLEQAGWVDTDGNGVRERDGEALRLEILNIAGEAERRQVVQIAQDQWRNVGFDVSIREIDAASFPPTMSEGEYQLAYGWFGENQEPVFNLWLGTNWQNYANEEALALLREVPATVDSEARGELVRRFQQMVADDVAMLPLAPRPILNAVSERLQGYGPTLSGSLWNAEEWTLR